MTETFHNLISRTKDLGSVSEVTIENGKQGLGNATKVINLNSSDGLAVNQYICQEIKRLLSSSFKPQVSTNNDPNFVIGKHILSSSSSSGNESKVVILDEIGTFELDVCKRIIQDVSLLKDVLLLRETDSLKYFISVCKFVQEEATFSNHLKFLVIYCSDVILEKIMNLLKSLKHRNIQVMVITIGKWPRMSTIKSKEDGTLNVEIL